VKHGAGAARDAVLAACLGLGLAPSLAAVDVGALWDFAHPEASEQRFRAALAGAEPDDALILQTQIARSYGLRGDFVQAREILRGIEAQPGSASAEVRVRHALEYGRTWVSATHPPESLTPTARAQGRAAFVRAHDLARAERLDGLAVDALHMLALVETEPAEQLKWNEQALALVEASTQVEAKAWEAALSHNAGYTLHQLGRYDEALTRFERAVELRERGTDAVATRTAYWMVAWTLRAIGRSNEALEIQLRLEREGDAARAPDPYVFEELEALYLARGDAERAARYAQRRKALGP
jgi:tetratricopeptide (TPR) repeat protein